MDTISLQREIPREQNKSDHTDSATKNPNVRLLAEIDERWEVSREEGADTTKKHLVDYDEWTTTSGELSTEVYIERR